MQIEDLKLAIKKNPQFALAFAAIFHLLIALTIFTVGRLGVVPQQFDRDGIGDFASDGHIHKPVMDALVGILRQGEFGSWINSKEAFHVKLFSLAGVVMEPLLGSNILTIEPLNLLFYLAIIALTFTLAKIVAGPRAAWLAALIVALWPSLVLHSTQFLRDPLVLIAVLTLITLLVLILKQNLNWQRATGSVVAAAAAVYLAWHTRPEMWLVVTAIIFVAGLLLVTKIAVTRKIVAVNLCAMAAVAALSVGMPRPSVGVVSMPLSRDVATPGDKTPVSGLTSIWGRVAIARERFIIHGRNAGSVIDEHVAFNSSTDIARYVPRALVVGYFAPFPSLWFSAGSKVGITGRILSGAEMVLTYLFEALACFFVWQTRRRFGSWLLVLATVIGMLALGLVVTNVGTLYRMRYPFWILIVIMAASVLASKYSAWFSSERETMKPASIPAEISPAT
jgi:hypothetical protein